MPLSDSASLVRHAHKHKYCVVQINTNGGTYDITRAIVEVAEELNSPVILGCYEANLKYRGYDYAAMQMRFFADRAKVPVAIHLDHGSTVDACQKAINAGFTSVMIDGSHLPIEQNLAQTKEVVALAKSKNISVEGEIGQLQKLNPDGSMPEVKNLSDPAEAKLMSQTGIDMLAVGIGNAHGFYKDAPVIRFDLLEKLAAASSVPLVLHGSTGLSDEVVQKCVSMGMAKANLGTLIRTRYVQLTRQVLQENTHQNHPWRLQQAVKDLLKPDIKHMLELCGGAGRAKELSL